MKHSLQKINPGGINRLQYITQVLRCIHLEGRLVLGKLGDARPCTFGGCAHDSEYPGDLVLVCCPWEKWASGIHLCHDTSSRPDVDASVVGATTKQNVWGSVPQGDDLIGKGVHWNTKCSSQSKVAQLQDPFTVNQKVLRLQVPVQDPVLVAEIDAFEELVHERLDRAVLEGPALSLSVHITLQVTVHVLEYEHQLVLRMNHIVERDNVLVLELLHKRNLPDRGRGCPLFGVEVNFLESHQFARLSIAAFEYLQIR